MEGIHKNIKEYNPNKERKILIVFDEMITDILSNKNPNPIVTELFIYIFLLFLLKNLILLFQTISD